MRSRIFALLIMSSILLCGFSSKTFSAGVKAFNTGKYQKAMTYFQKTLKQYPAEAIVHYNLGMAYFKGEQYPAALASFQSAMQLDDKFEPLSRFYLGLCYYQNGDNEKARKELQWVAQICENSSIGDAAKEVIKAL